MMTPNRIIGQTPPDKANELFAQLLHTSNEAVELRDQLLAALRQELELLVSLQEQHLFPVLEQHQETTELVRGARDDHRQTRDLLDHLEAVPKDSDAFLAQVAELQRVFQQHIRNDKNELLPEVLKVLSQDEVEAVVEKVEEEIAEAEETRRAAAEPRRTRRARKQAEAVSNMNEPLLAAGEAMAENIKAVEQPVPEAPDDSVRAASARGRRTPESSGRRGREAQTLFEQAPDYFQAIAQSNRILARGAGTITLEWFGLRQDHLLKNLEAAVDVLNCRTIPDLVRFQASLVRGNIERMLENSHRLTQLTAQVAEQATWTITGQPELDRRAR